MINMNQIIQFNNVGKKYGNVVALNGMSFSVSQYEAVGLVGNNGCGKTSTINIMCNLIKYNNGEVIVFNKKVTPLNVSYKNKLGILISPPVFVDEFTPSQYLRFVCKFQHVDPKEISKRIGDVTTLFNIVSVDKIKIARLSAGEKMKVALAAAIIHNPEVLVFDEPFIHLDIHTIDLLTGLINTIRNNKTLFITSHNLDLIINVCSRFLIMEKGRIIDNILKEEGVTVDMIKTRIKEKITAGRSENRKPDWLS